MQSSVEKSVQNKTEWNVVLRISPLICDVFYWSDYNMVVGYCVRACNGMSVTLLCCLSTGVERFLSKIDSYGTDIQIIAFNKIWINSVIP